jgi:hypothetical protein
MISNKPVRWKASLSIRDNLDPDSNATEESDSHLEKQFSPNNSTDAGMRTNSRSLFVNAINPIRDNFETFSITTDLMYRMHSEAMDSIPEGSQSLIPKKVPGEIDETNRMTPSITINRGQNSQLTVQIG